MSSARNVRTAAKSSKLVSGRRSPWTKARRETFERYVATVSKRMGLTGWRIDVDWGTSPEESCAEIARWDNQRRATLYVGRSFLSLSDVDRRNTVVHELAHCLLFDLHDVAERSVAVLGGQAAELATALLNAEVEKATDAVATAVEKGVPYLDVGV